jgi:hypothetical protein
MSHHQTLNIQAESTLELFPPLESQILVEAIVEIFTDENYGADADGRRGQTVSEVNSVELISLRLYVPNRPTLLLFTSEREIAHFLEEGEFNSLVDLVCEKAFLDSDSEEVDW